MQAIDLYSELNALGIRFEPIGYVKAPQYPYGVYDDDVEVKQPDTAEGARIINHEITIEIYHPDYNDLMTSAKTLEAWINSIPFNYKRQIAYVIDEDHYSATYAFNYTTKERDD